MISIYGRIFLGFVIINLMFFCINSKTAIAAGTDTVPNANLPAALTDSLNLNDLSRFIENLDRETADYLPRLDPKSWGLTGPDWDMKRLGKGILEYFLKELVFNFKILGELLLLVMALAILQNLKHAFESETISQIAFGICFLVVMSIVLNSFRVMFLITHGALTEMTNFMYAITPLLFSLITAGGGVTTTTVVHPLLISMVTMIGGVISNFVFPLIMFAGILGFVNYLFEGFQINKLANLLKTIALGILGLAMVIFIGIITIKGFAASVADSTVLRTAKYFSNALPVVGGVLSDTMEMTAGCSLILKSGIGIYGLGLVILITVFPLIKILAVSLIYQISGAISQPLGNKQFSDALQTVGGTFLNLFGVLAVVGLMFFIAISVLVGVANFGGR